MMDQDPLYDQIDELLNNPHLTGLGVAEQRDRLFRLLMARAKNQRRPPALIHLPIFRRAAAAAILVLIIGAAIYLARNHKQSPAITIAQYKGDVSPGHNGATLHLSNGTTILLDSAQNGTIATQGSIRAIKSDGQLKYTGRTTELVFNTISTDRGRQWRLTLPDGTRVWLNAASSIHYPLSFTGPERRVDLTGEAYFEVAHNAGQPFTVNAGGQTIRDIGTAFNINAYSDEPATKTTLVEGAATVNGTLLKPGQQGILIDNHIQLSVANIPQALAWKNGFFGFDHADIHTVMRQLSRWYDVDVKFVGTPDNTPFQGKIGRDLSLAQVLKILEQESVHFKIEEDKRIIIQGVQP
jgi:transmembrane sensor